MTAKSFNDSNDPMEEIASLEREIARLAPLFDGLGAQAALAPPPACVIDAINAEARRSIRRRSFERRVRRCLRFSAAAAAAALLLVHAMHVSTERENSRREEVLNQLCIVSSEDGALPAGQTEASMAVLAEMLMEMQGLDEDTYFNVIL
jgi:hypothetical protein